MKKRRHASVKRRRIHLEEKMGMTAMLDMEGMTKDLVDDLIEKIDVYGDDRVEIKWKFSILRFETGFICYL